MRPVLQSDVTTAARALLAVPVRGREELCACLLRQADCADRFTRRLGKAHPVWGNGTLLAAARAHALGPERTFDDPAWCMAVETVIRQIRTRKARRHL